MTMKEKNSLGGASRRDFLKIATCGGVATASVLLAGCSSSENSGKAGSTATGSFDQTTDVLVLGGGSGGCFAANYAMRQGASAIVVEADERIGGTTLLSGGFYHTWDITPENIDQMLASADPERRTFFINKWTEVCDWVLNESGLEADPLDMDYPLYGAHLVGFSTSGTEKAAGRQMFLEDLIEGATVLLETHLVDLIAVEDGSIVGAVVRDRQGNTQTIGAKATVIATGSFQNNKGMIEQHLGRWADCSVCRATPYNTGVGINLALQHGARLSKGTGHFYGHMNPWPALTPHTEEDYVDPDFDEMQGIMGAIQKFSVEGIAVNTNGLRFTDEGPENYVGDNYLANDSTQEMDGHCFVVIDSAQDHKDGLKIISDAGGVVLSADTVEDLAEQMKAYKVNPANFKKTVAEYQEAAVVGTADQLTIPKTPMPTGYLTKLDTPPFYAVQAAAGISGFYGGLETTNKGEVVDFADRPIKGLYAVPMASGGVFYKEYGGGLALCAAFGAAAGEAIGAYVKTQQEG